MGRVSILALRCPNCGSNLAGMENDHMFCCSDCRIAFEPDEDRFLRHSISVLTPRQTIESGSVFWAPFWLFDVTTKVDAMPTETKRAEEIIIQYPQTWIAAFRMWRPAYFGNPGYLYTCNRIEPLVAEQRDPPVLIGCSLGRDGAKEFVKPFMLSVIDKRVDVAAIDISCEITGARLMAVPFSLHEDKVKDTQINWEYSAMMFEDLTSMIIE